MILFASSLEEGHHISCSSDRGGVQKPSEYGFVRMMRPPVIMAGRAML